MIDSADLQILIAARCKQASEKAGSPRELVTMVDHITELMAMWKALQEKK